MSAPDPAGPGGHRLLVVGAGTMGVGITTLALGHGVPVTLVDVEVGALADARIAVRQRLKLARMLGALPDRPPASLDTASTPSGAGVVSAVVEAVTESAEAKAAALETASVAVEPGTPVVSNTSSIPIDELARSVPRPEDLLGTHFMNPPYLIRMVELIRGVRTGPHAEQRFGAVLDRLARVPVVVRDRPGFVTSRILHPMINDAIRVVAEGTASAADVDRLFEGCLGHRTGPLRTADLIGLDNLADSLAVLHERTADEGARPHPLLLAKVRDGDLGEKTGRGFHEHGDTTGGKS